MKTQYFDAIRSFEGYAERATWDYRQFSSGYGTRARFAGEVIDKAEAERRFQAEIAQARDAVVRFAPSLDDGSTAALTSLTHNAGTGWMSSGLGQAVKAGDLATAKAIFSKYVHAGGEVLPGLVRRRGLEAEWFGQTLEASSVHARMVAASTVRAQADPPTSGQVAAPTDAGVTSGPDGLPRTKDAAPERYVVDANLPRSTPSTHGIGSKPFGALFQSVLAVLAEMRLRTPDRSNDARGA